VENTDRPSLDALVTANLDLVAIVARQVTRELGAAARHLEDLEGAGREGLVSAAKRFDPERGVPFRRFANHRVRGAMIDLLRRESSLPRPAREKLHKLESALSLNEAASEGMAASAVVSADARLAEHLANLATAMATGLLCERALDDGESVAVAGGESAEDTLAREQLREVVRAAVDALPEQERKMVVGHYYEGRRFDEVAAEMGLSKSWGSRLHSRAVGRLTERLRALR
jgi:RNA polymerase sigma factor FliA